MDECETKRIRSYFNIDKQDMKKQLKWTKENDKRLIGLIENYPRPKINWSEIADHFDHKTKTQCYSRYRQINPSLNKGTWSKNEEELLVELVNKYGKNWAKIATIHKTRSGKQIRDHFNYCINNKNNFTEEEDIKIKNLYLEYGNKFSMFTKYLPGRTGEAIKNRFHSSIKRKYNLLSQIAIKTLEEEQKKEKVKPTKKKSTFVDLSPKTKKYMCKLEDAMEELNSTSMINIIPEKELSKQFEENFNLLSSEYLMKSNSKELVQINSKGFLLYFR